MWCGAFAVLHLLTLFFPELPVLFLLLFRQDLTRSAYNRTQPVNDKKYRHTKQERSQPLSANSLFLAKW
jgi:hypothetical protein